MYTVQQVGEEENSKAESLNSHRAILARGIKGMNNLKYPLSKVC